MAPLLATKEELEPHRPDSFAKELMIHPREKEPLICWSLKLAQSWGAQVVVISRNEKRDLNQFLRSQKIVSSSDLSLVEIASSLEWPESILLSRKHWGDRNLLILPDTRFESPQTALHLVEDLDKYEISFATFSVDDPEKWGVLCSQNPLVGCEKPQLLKGPQKAWGVIAFRNSIGTELFEKLLRSTMTRTPYQLSCWSNWRDLKSFVDLTRSNWNSSATHFDIN